MTTPQAHVYATPYVAGASEVKGKIFATASDSSTRATIVTPTSGKQMRVIAVNFSNASTTAVHFEIYFSNPSSHAANINAAGAEPVAWVASVDADGVTSVVTLVWPDGGGPVGTADYVLSLRTSADISGGAIGCVHYREE